MLRAPAFAVTVLLVTGCASGGAGGDDPAVELARRVRAVLTGPGGGQVIERAASFGFEIPGAALAEGALLCPRVIDPDPGDEATCRLTVGDRELEIDVAFEAGGGIRVVDALMAP